MKCLHCGVELALIKKLTGGIEFCSEEHRAAYFEEYSRLALDRLFEAHEPPSPVVVHSAPKAEPAAEPPPAKQEQAPAAADFLIEATAAGLADEPRPYEQEPLTEAHQYVFPHSELPAAGDALAGVATEPVVASSSGSLYGRLQQKGLVGRPPAKSAPKATSRYSIATRPPLRDVLAWPIADLRSALRTDQPPPVDFPGQAEWAGLIRLHLATTGFDFVGEATPGAEQHADPAPPVSEPVLEPEPPAVRENPLPLHLECQPPGQNRRDLSYAALAYGPERVHLPGIVLSTLTPQMAFGPRPAANTEREPTVQVHRTTQKARILPGNPTKPGHPAIAGRPPSPVSTAITTTAPPKLEAIPQPTPPVQTASPKAEVATEIPVTFDAPRLEVTSGGFLASMPGWAKAVVLVLILAGAGFGIWQSSAGSGKKTQAGPSRSGSAAAMAIAMGAGGWTVEQAADEAGEALGRQLRLYKPTLTMRDYVLEFSGKIEARALGWAFRVADTRNYYVMKLEAIRGGTGEVKLIRYAVVAGEEQTHTTVNLPFPARLDTVYRVRVEVKGPKFTTSVQGRPVDFWTDSQLLSGGVGFLNDREERGRIDSVQISF